MGFHNNVLSGSAGQQGYQISRSVRLRSSASASFSRTFGAGNRKTWTYSGCVKRGQLGGVQTLIANNFASTGGLHNVYFSGDQLIAYYEGSSGTVKTGWITNAVFRDPSAWYHVMIVFDTTQAVVANMCKFYINGVLQSTTTNNYSATYISQNTDAWINTTGYTHYLGSSQTTNTYYFDGYFAEINFIDGQALTPSSFGQNDPLTGVWQPKKYLGTYGTNGFYLNFSDNSAATAAAIGKDSSGNGNNWTPNNISVTAGVTYDSMIDTPTPYADGGNGRGNYATLNPLWYASSFFTLSNANQTFAGSGTTTGSYVVTSTMGLTSGKWYWEVTPTDIGAGPNIWVGIQGVSRGTSDAVGAVMPGTGYAYSAGGSKLQDTTVTSYGAAYANGDVVGVALDLDGGTLTFYKNGVSQGTAFTGVSAASTPTGAYTPVVMFTLGGVARTIGGSANFGQRPFAYTPPTGFKALNTQNLPDATIKQGNKYFDANLYTGTGAAQNILNAAGFQPDLVWVKSRSSASYSHRLFDSIRGVNIDLQSNTTNGDTSEANSLTAFNSNGYSVGSDAVGGGVNTNAVTYVGWQWKKGATQGFDVVAYTGTGVATTVAHSLGVAPKMIIAKSRSSGTAGWPVYHASIGAANYLALNTTAASAAGAVWNSTTPTSSVFSVGATGNGINDSGATYVAYLFSEVAGFSKFGSYVGNGSADGTFVYCGFRPRFILVKRTDAAYNWFIFDSAVNQSNVAANFLQPNSSAAQGGTNGVDLLSNGFKWRDSSIEMNASGGTYIFCAFAENPFKNSLAR